MKKVYFKYVRQFNVLLKIKEEENAILLLAQQNWLNYLTKLIQRRLREMIKCLCSCCFIKIFKECYKK